MAEKSVVLAIDDKLEVLMGISEILSGDYDVRAVKNAAAAMRLLKEEKVDLVILDIDMPVLSGFDLLTFMRRNTESPKIPVVFITAVTDPEVIKKARECNTEGFLTKPFYCRTFAPEGAEHPCCLRAPLKLFCILPLIFNYFRVVRT